MNKSIWPQEDSNDSWERSILATTSAPTSIVIERTFSRRKQRAAYVDKPGTELLPFLATLICLASIVNKTVSMAHRSPKHSRYWTQNEISTLHRDDKAASAPQACGRAALSGTKRPLTQLHLDLGQVKLRCTPSEAS